MEIQELKGVRVLSSDVARPKWRAILDVAAGGRDVVVERHGKPVVAVIPFEDYLALLDELEDLRDARIADERVAEWRRDPTVARPYTEIRAELVAEGILDE